MAIRENEMYAHLRDNAKLIAEDSWEAYKTLSLTYFEKNDFIHTQERDDDGVVHYFLNRGDLVMAKLDCRRDTAAMGKPMPMQIMTVHDLKAWKNFSVGNYPCDESNNYRPQGLPLRLSEDQTWTDRPLKEFVKRYAATLG